MPQAPVLQVTLTQEAFEFVRSKVTSGEYSSESHVLNDFVETLREEDQQRTRWEQEVVGPIYDRMKADPSRGIPLDEVRRRLEERRRKRHEVLV